MLGLSFCLPSEEKSMHAYARAAETLKHHPRVDWLIDWFIYLFIDSLIDSLIDWLMISQTVQQLSHWQTDTHHTPTNRHCWKQCHLRYAIAARLVNIICLYYLSLLLASFQSCGMKILVYPILESVLLWWKGAKLVCFAPDSTAGTHDAPRDLIVGLGRG